MASDAFKMGDGVETNLQCGHPNVEAGRRCELCGQVVERQEIQKEEQREKKP